MSCSPIPHLFEGCNFFEVVVPGCYNALCTVATTNKFFLLTLRLNS